MKRRDTPAVRCVDRAPPQLPAEEWSPTPAWVGSILSACYVGSRGRSGPARGTRVPVASTYSSRRATGSRWRPHDANAPADLLRELDHESVRVGDMQGAMAPGTAGRLAEQRDAAGSQRGGHRVDVLDDEHDLAGRTRPHRTARSATPSAARRAPTASGPSELGVPRVGEPVLQPGHVAVEPHRRDQIGDEPRPGPPSWRCGTAPRTDFTTRTAHTDRSINTRPKGALPRHRCHPPATPTRPARRPRARVCAGA
jgi:hypothetical protein